MHMTLHPNTLVSVSGLSPNCTITMAATPYGVNSLINQECSHLLNQFFLALSSWSLSLHIIGVIAYNLLNTVSVCFKTQTHFIVSENHAKAYMWLFTAAEANSQYLASGYTGFC